MQTIGYYPKPIESETLGFSLAISVLYRLSSLFGKFERL